MKHSNTTIRELSAQYRSVLKKCFMLNAIVLMGLFSYTAKADDYANLEDLTHETANMGTVTIENKEVSSNYGSVVFVPNGVNAVLGENSIIRNNTAGIGTIGISKKEGNLQIGSGSLFHNNTAKYDGGAIGNYGGAIIANNVTFKENKAQTTGTDYQAIGGGAISLGIDAQTTITGSYFENNESGYNGGAIGTRKTLQDSEVTDAETRNSLSIDNSTFKGNKALGTTVDTSDSKLVGTGNGGAIANTFATVQISNTTFDENKAANYGGAIFNMPYENAKSTAFYDLGGKITLTGTTFTDNEAKSGGAIYNKGTLTFEGTSKFSDNSANLGGAIFNDTNAVIGDITEGSFTNNKAEAYKAADVAGGTDVYAQGGVIYNKGQIGNITADFIGNSATTKSETASKATANGGALALYQSTIETITGNFDGNSAKAEIIGDNHDYADDMISGSKLVSAGGGAIHIEGKWASGDTTKIGGIIGNFTNNSAQGDAYANGGAIYMKAGPNTDVSIDQITGNFENNSVIASTSDTDVKKDSTGGAISIKVDGGKMATLNVAGNFTGNSVSTNVTNALGGAVYNEGTFNVSDSTFAANTANSTSGNALGGAIYNTADGIISLSGTNAFSNNMANGIANDIYNLGTLNISSGTTTIGSGIDGTGSLIVSGGATLDIGTTKVAQDSITFNEGSTLKANLLNTTSYGSLVANTITANGAALNLTVGSAGDYVIATGAGADSFADAIVDSSSLYDIVKTSQDENTLTYTATIKAAEDIATSTGVSEQAASVLTTVANASNDTASQIALNLQNELAAGNIDVVEKATTDLAPTNTSTVHSVATTVQSQVLSVVNNRLAAPTMGRSGGDVKAEYGPWAQGLYNRSKQDASSSTSGFRGYTQGVAFGLDTLINDVYTVGVGYAYNTTDVKSAGRTTDIYGHNFFVYGEYQPNAWFVNGTLNYSTSDYKEARSVTGVGVSGKYDVDTWGGQIMAGYDTELGLTPKAGLRYLHIKQDSYTDTAGQNIKTDNTDLLTAVIGGNYSYTFVEEGYSLKPEVRLAATYDLVSDNADATVVMGTSSYTTTGKRLPRFGVEAGVGLTMNVADAVDISLNYDAGIRRDYTSHTGTLKLKYNF